MAKHHGTTPSSGQPRPTLPKPGRIVPGDGLVTMAGWPDNCVDLVFADPPYNIGYDYAGHYHDALPDDEYIDWTQRWIDACARLLKPSGSLYILIGDEYAAEVRVHLKKLEREGQLAFRNWIVWHYTFGQNCRLKFNRSHAHLFYCVGSGALKRKKRRTGEVTYEQVAKVKDPPFTFNKKAIAVASARQTTYNDARANPKGKLPDDTWYLRPQEVEAEGIERYFRADEDTWYLSRLCGTFKERLGWHSCQLPEALLERIVKLSSHEDDLVFDPFAGSGTTLAAAAKLNRRWLGCELSDEFAEKAQARVQEVQATGKTVQTDQKSKGIVRGEPKKKAEPKRSRMK